MSEIMTLSIIKSQEYMRDTMNQFPILSESMDETIQSWSNAIKSEMDIMNLKYIIEQSTNGNN